MWNELNRILGGDRNDGRTAGEEARDPGAPLPENAPAAPADATAPESKNEAPRTSDDQTGEFENLPEEDFVDDPDWGAILGEDSAFVPPPADRDMDLPGRVAASAEEAMAPPPLPDSRSHNRHARNQRAAGW